MGKRTHWGLVDFSEFMTLPGNNDPEFWPTVLFGPLNESAPVLSRYS